MAVKFEDLPGEPILIAAFENPLQAGKDTSTFNEAIHSRLETISPDHVLWVISDLSGVTINFADAIFGLAEAARGSTGAFRDRRVRMVLIGVGDMIKFLVNAAEQSQYGGVKGHVCSSLEEALAYCREAG